MLFPLIPSKASLQSIQNLIQLSGKRDSLPPLAVGEVIELTVIDKTINNKTHILIKGTEITAHADIPLAKGERRLAEVQKLVPHIILRLIQKETNSSQELSNYVRRFCGDSKGLMNFFMQAEELLSPHNAVLLESVIKKEEIEKLRDLLTSTFFSRTNATSKFFLRDYLHNLGFLLERNLAKMLKRTLGQGAEIKKISQNMKSHLYSLLQRLSSEEARGAELSTGKISDFLIASLKMIESHQVVNFLLQDNENSYVFQIPVYTSDSMSMAEIIVKWDDEQEKKDTKRQKVVFLLAMDVLGDMIIEAETMGKMISCIIKCREELAVKLVSPFLNELSERLSESGFQIGHLDCRVTDGIEKQKEDYRNSYLKSFHERLDLVV